MKKLTDIVHRGTIAGLATTNAPKLFETLFEFDWYNSLHIEWVKTVTKDEKHLKILEIGCGPGSLLHALACNGHDSHGVDKSIKMVKYAQKSYPNQSNLQFKHAEGGTLPYENNQFDAVIAASVINVVDNPWAILKEARRVAKTNAVSSFILPSPQMTASAADHYAKENNITGLSAAALHMWASLSKKIPEEKALDIAEESGMRSLSVRHYLEGMIYSVSEGTQ